MPSPGMRGWYVELDEELVKEFDRLFPDHGAKARITEDAVIRAVSNARFENEEDLSPQEGLHVQRNEGNTGRGR